MKPASRFSWLALEAPPIAAQQGTHLYGLFDAAQIEGFRKRIIGLSCFADTASLYPPPLAPDRFDATPHLIEVEDIGAFQRIASALDKAYASHGAMTWIVSSLPIQTLADRLRRRLDAKLPDDFDCINRYYDGRVLPHLQACLTSAQREAFFSPMVEWWLLNPAFAWEALPCRYDETDTYEAPLRLDEGQEAHLIDACYPYAVIDHFENTDPELLDAIAPSARYAHFDKALQTAKRFGIDGGDQAILFCALTLTRGTNFYESEAWQTDLARVRDGKTTLREVMKARHD